MKKIATLIAAGVTLSAAAIAQTHYAVKDLGPAPNAGFSYSPVITNSGFSAGWISRAAGPRHATLWHEGQFVADIGAPGLGGPNSEAFGVNERGQVAAQGETPDPDPNGEDFCGFQVLVASNPSCPYCSGADSGHTCRPFIWDRGTVQQLPLLSGKNGGKGNNGGVSHINNRGEVVGLAENTTADPDCGAPQKFEFKPVIWRNGQVVELSTFPGDKVGFAFGINDNSEVVGGSGACASFDPLQQLYSQPIHALFWDRNGEMQVIADLEGQAGSTADDINNRGQVVGSSGMYGFVWTKAKGTQQLNPLSADLLSFAAGINDPGQVVGGSLDDSFTVLSAVLWESGPDPVNLNSLVVDNPSGLYLQLAEGINARGEIVGFGSVAGDLNNIPHAFLATPVFGNDSVSAGVRVAKPVSLAGNARNLLQKKMRLGRFGTAVPRALSGPGK
jgi:uncharacterized membrane protein